MKPECDKLPLAEPQTLYRDNIRLAVSASGTSWIPLGEVDDGAWTDLSIDLDIPADWLTDLALGDLTLRAWAKSENADELVGEWDVLALDVFTVQGRDYKRARVQGQLARGFRVELGNQGRTPRTSTAVVVLQAWGTQGGTPGVWGEVSSITSRTHTPRVGLGYALDDTGRWFPLQREGTGELRVTGTLSPSPGSRFIVDGDTTPADNIATRTDTVPSWSFGSVWDANTSRWFFARGSAGVAMVQGSQTVVDGIANPTDAVHVESWAMGLYDGDGLNYQVRLDGNGWTRVNLGAGNLEDLAGDPANFGFGVACSNLGFLFTLPGIPDASAPNPINTSVDRAANAQTKVLKASRGYLTSVSGSNDSTTTGYYLCLVDKGSAPVNGDAIVDAWYVPPSSVVCPAIERYLLTLGVALCASSTCTTVTLATPSGCFSGRYT